PNGEPFGGAVATKAALFSVEAHLTHNFSRRIWISGDMLYRSGGETSLDGVPNDDAQSGWSAGASAAFPLAPRLNVIFTYQHVVARNDSGPVGWFFRTAFVAPF